jgi:hypothetical protein
MVSAPGTYIISTDQITNPAIYQTGVYNTGMKMYNQFTVKVRNVKLSL